MTLLTCVHKIITNEELKQESKDIKKRMHTLYTKIDNLESHSRRSKWFHAIPGKVGEKWEDTEVKVSQFIKNDLDLPELENVSGNRE